MAGPGGRRGLEHALEAFVQEHRIVGAVEHPQVADAELAGRGQAVAGGVEAQLDLHPVVAIGLEGPRPVRGEARQGAIRPVQTLRRSMVVLVLMCTGEALARGQPALTVTSAAKALGPTRFTAGSSGHYASRPPAFPSGLTTCPATAAGSPTSRSSTHDSPRFSRTTPAPQSVSAGGAGQAVRS